MTTRQDSALLLASLGFRIFPLRPGSKEPYRDEGWKAIMTTDPERIKRWFAERQDMNYAVVCDEHHVILDPDQGTTKQGRVKDGESHFRRAEEEALGFVEDSIWNNTLRVRTPKGGSHLYFNSGGKAYANSVSTIIQDVDVRGPDGYVVGPNCWTANDPERNTVEGDYEVQTDGDIADLPDWLRAKLDQGGTVGKRAENAGSAAHAIDTPSAVEQACRVLRNRPPAIEGEGGDHHTVMTAMQLKDYGISEEKCLDLMFAKTLFAPTRDYPQGRSWNETCEPPWDFDDLRTKVHNGYTYGNRQIGSKMDALSSFGDEVAAPSVDGMDGMQETLKPGEHYSAIEQPIGQSDNRARAKASIHDFGSFIDREVIVDNIVPKWVPARGVTAILAKRGTGKSVFLCDFSCCIATDTPWNGIEIAKDWAVVYLCGEDDTGLQLNLEAWAIHHGMRPANDRFKVADRVPNLMDPEDVKAWAEELKAQFKGRKVVVIVDTWQRATSSASQNDDKEMQKAIHQAEGLARYLDGCAIIAFHPPKGRDDTITGSMVLENSTYAILTITSTGANERHIQVTRIKGPGEGNYAVFNIQEFGAGFDKKGIEKTGALPVYKGGNKNGPAQEKIDREESVRNYILSEFEDTLTQKDRVKRGVTLKEVADWVLSQITHEPDGMLASYFRQHRHEDEAKKLLNAMFPVTKQWPISRGAFVKNFKGSLMIGDGL